ncbi:MAG: Pimeloyl-ACP methyl ester carboxylesterase [Chloroflexi bacterium AL-W]|nr:Pimeloyl-ACP methyl ester carboxylesterase [Chloroflexi bacterium AL-N1]NOK65379.1 Pimeloyl-ACP methyl ester carboxylesterase [Chloroflexi bacterium AL-N10]NOK72355.1 Pimeloyl-ACP methyl ester carboxylesterase [Chloroflexi bacterium AL-N5]NOK79558.1 Pimeloyl-ACP methyl ester carboxylesterase [Chloroflexi bacterium AL-W]NOK87474.1 Pimeloyl-ACP methyl ester carboxylesterase [Chloroflexi bacterium AL-N15]
MSALNVRHMGNPRGVRPEWINSVLYPFQSNFLELDGHTLHYIDEGPCNGPVLLFLHGNPMWSFEFRHLVQALRSAFRCIAPDLPGFGLSTPEETYRFLPEEHASVIEHFIQRLELQHITMYVHDWSGPIGLGAAARHPERFRSLLIGSTWARPDIGGVQRMSSRFLDNGFGRYLVQQHNIFIERLLNMVRAKHPLNQDELEHYRRPFPDPVARDRYHLLNRHIVRGHDFLSRVQRELPRLSHLPVLFVWSEKDQAFPISELRRFEKVFPHHHTVILKEAGHFGPEEAPDQIVFALRTWWQKQEGHNI